MTWPCSIDQRPTAVAWIHGCIRLDVRNPLALSNGVGSVDGADNSSCDGVVEAKGITDGNGPFTGLQVIGVAQGCHWQVFGDHLHHCNVGERVTPEHFAFEASPIGKGDGHLVGASNDMFIGENQSIASRDEARALSLLLLGGRTDSKNPSKRIIDFFHHINAHHGGPHPVHRFHNHILSGLEWGTSRLVIDNRWSQLRRLGTQPQLGLDQTA
jgi:hypothetical protein